jgi:hypothetical protein
MLVVKSNRFPPPGLDRNCGSQSPHPAMQPEDKRAFWLQAHHLPFHFCVATVVSRLAVVCGFSILDDCGLWPGQSAIANVTDKTSAAVVKKASFIVVSWLRFGALTTPS